MDRKSKKQAVIDLYNQGVTPENCKEKLNFLNAPKHVQKAFLQKYKYYPERKKAQLKESERKTKVRAEKPQKPTDPRVKVLYIVLGIIFSIGIHTYLILETIEFFRSINLDSANPVFLGVLIELAVVIGAISKKRSLRVLGVWVLALNTLIYSYFSIYSAIQARDKNIGLNQRYERLTRHSEELSKDIKKKQELISNYMESWQEYAEKNYLSKGIKTFGPMIDGANAELANLQKRKRSTEDEIDSLVGRDTNEEVQVLEIGFVIASKFLLALFSFLFLVNLRDELFFQKGVIND